MNSIQAGCLIEGDLLQRKRPLLLHSLRPPTEAVPLSVGHGEGPLTADCGMRERARVVVLGAGSDVDRRAAAGVGASRLADVACWTELRLPPEHRRVSAAKHPSDAGEGWNRGKHFCGPVTLHWSVFVRVGDRMSSLDSRFSFEPLWRRLAHRPRSLRCHDARLPALCSGAEWLECLALRDVEPTQEGWRIKLSTDSGDRRVDTPFVIDTTGRACVFARRVGAKRIAMDRLVGAAGYFSFRAPSSMMEPVLLLEAAESGWWYTAPLPEGKLIAVFLTDADFIQREKLTQPDRWMAQLSSTVEQSRRIQKHGLSLEGEIRIVQAESSFLDRVAGDGWLAAGDAAACFDPLSAQGITSAVNSGLDAAHAAAAWLSGDRKAPVAYADHVRRGYAEYLTNRSVYYRIERRWQNGEFWKTRQALPSVFSARRTSACA